MAGLFDLDMSNPEAQGFNSALMQAAAALLTPRHRGGGMGAAFAAFPQAIDRAQQQAQRARLLGMQEQQLGLQGQKLNFEMDEATAKRKREDALRLAQGQFWQRYAGKPVSPEMFAHGQLIGIKPDDLKALAESPNWGKTKLDFHNGVGVDPYTGQPMATVPDVNAAFNPGIGPDGKVVAQANLPAQQYGLTKARAGAPNFSPTINSFPRVQDEIDKGMAKSLVERHQQLVHAPAALDNIEKAKALVGRSGGFVGSFGEKKLEVVQFLNNNLGLGISPDEVASASELRSRVFMGIMENLKKMDAQPSQLQQQVMQDALGRITTDPGALPRVLDVFGDIVRNKVKIHNDQVRAAGDNNIRFAYPIKIDLPAKRLPENFNASSLQKGEVYELPDGRTAEWDGFRFKVR